jgi:hypothetical protein
MPVFRALADILRMIGGTLASIVMLPFRLLARLFGGAADTGRAARPRRASRGRAFRGTASRRPFGMGRRARRGSAGHRWHLSPRA